jgi:hypothetical protein
VSLTAIGLMLFWLSTNSTLYFSMPIELPSFDYEDEDGGIIVEGVWNETKGRRAFLGRALLEVAHLACAGDGCILSTGTLSLRNDKAALSAELEAWKVARWDEKLVITVPIKGICHERVLIINRQDRVVTMKRTFVDDGEVCVAALRINPLLKDELVLTLVDGEEVQNASPSEQR